MKRLALLLAALLLLSCAAPAALAAEDGAVFPSGSSSKYIPYTTSLPEIIWTTTGEENGLIGSVYQFEGLVLNVETVETDTGGVTQLSVETKDGRLIVADMYGAMRASMYDAGLEDFFYLNIEESGADYTPPEIDDRGLFYAVYAGYSMTAEKPVFYLGVNEYIVDQLRDPRSVPVPGAADDHQPTFGEQNALRDAEEWLGIKAFSYADLIERLEKDDFTHEEAVFAADRCGADWYEQAVLCAEEWLDIKAFSRAGLIERLEKDGFTHEEAVYAAEQVGY